MYLKTCYMRECKPYEKVRSGIYLIISLFPKLSNKEMYDIKIVIYFFHTQNTFIGWDSEYALIHYMILYIIIACSYSYVLREVRYI